MKGLIVGATGLIGTHCLETLLNDDLYSNVEIWVRKTTGLSHPKLTEKQIDFERITELSITDIDHVFCCLGTTIKKAKTQEVFLKIDKQYVSELAHMAEQSGCEKFLVISSIGANKNSKNFYLRTKGEMEYAVKSYSIPAIYIFRPSMLLGKRKEFRLGEQIGKILMIGFQFLLIGKMKKYRGIKASTIAIAMCKVAKLDKKGINIIESDEIQILGK